jgi:putative MATE family efflux protein
MSGKNFMPNEKLLLTGKISQLAWRFAAPSIISMVVFALYNIVDRIFIGHIPEIGSLAMTGIGLTAPILTVSFALIMLISIGSATLISLRLGEKKIDQAQACFNNSLELTIYSQAILMILIWLLMSPILQAIGVDEQTRPHAQTYLTIVTSGLLVSGVVYTISNALRSAGHPNIATICNVTSTLINIILDALFIFVFNWGVAGAAWATVISQVIALMIVLWFVIAKKDNLAIKLKKLNWRLNLAMTTRVIKIGFAPFSMQMSNTVVIILINSALLQYGGNMAVAALTIIFSIMNLTNLPMIGYIQGVQAIIGFNYGAKAYLRVREIMIYSFKVALLFGVVASIFIFGFTKPMINIFSTDTEVVAIATTGIKIFMGLIAVLGVQILCSTFFQSIGSAKHATFLSLLRQVILFIPLLYILPRFWGVHGVWWAGFICDALATIISLIVFLRSFLRLPKVNQTSPPLPELKVPL